MILMNSKSQIHSHQTNTLIGIMTSSKARRDQSASGLFAAFECTEICLFISISISVVNISFLLFAQETVISCPFYNCSVAFPHPTTATVPSSRRATIAAMVRPPYWL
jgi:hypothetical protein